MSSTGWGPADVKGEAAGGWGVAAAGGGEGGWQRRGEGRWWLEEDGHVGAKGGATRARKGHP
jgi:hypothetical protein